MSHIYEYETWAVCHSVKSLIVFRRHYSSLSFCSSRIPHSLHCYTLKLSAAVQNRSPTPAICPSYANPVVSIVPKQLSVNLRPGNAMFFADFYPSLGWNSELPTILWFTPILAAEKNVAEYHICTAWIWLEYSLLWLNCPNLRNN